MRAAGYEIYKELSCGVSSFRSFPAGSVLMDTLRNTFITRVEYHQIQPYKVIRTVCSFRSKFFHPGNCNNETIQ